METEAAHTTHRSNDPSARSMLVAAIGDFRRTWPQLLAADLVARTLGLVLLTPIVGLALKLFLMTTATGVLTDAAIVEFLLHPTGIAALAIIASVSLAVLFAETGQLMVIGFGAIEDNRVTWRTALQHVGRRAAALVELAGFALLRLLLIALPFLAAIAALSWLCLRAYDINYYLAKRPPEFIAVLAVSGVLLTVMSLWIVARIAGWVHALPMVLFEDVRGRQALRASDRAIESKRWQVAGWLVAFVAAPLLMMLLINLVAGGLANALPRDLSHVNLLLAGLVAILLASGVAHLALLVVPTVLFPLFVVRFYRAVAGATPAHRSIDHAGPLENRGHQKRDRRVVAAIAAGVLVTLVCGGYGMAYALDWEDRTVIIAHRGGADAAPENTLAAFHRAISDGADWLELDVQEDADGVVIVVHDRDFMRVAGSALAVHEATAARLAPLDIGSYFAPEFAAERVPTLREVLQLAKGRVGLFIELKYYGWARALESKVVELVEDAGMASDIVIMSLEYDGVRKAAALRPDWTCGLLNAVAVGDPTRLEVNFLALASRAASYHTIRRAHQRGMRVYAWTINDPVQMSVMMSRGVDGIITDRVALARRVQELRSALTPVGRFVIWMAGEAGLLRGVQTSSPEEDA